MKTILTIGILLTPAVCIGQIAIEQPGPENSALRSRLSYPAETANVYLVPDAPSAPAPVGSYSSEAVGYAVAAPPSASPSDAPTESDAAHHAVTPHCCPPPEPQPWTIPQPCLLQNLGVRMGGWVQQGISFNGHGRRDGFNGPVGTNDFNGEYQMNQAWLFFDRPADNSGSGWAIGGRLDMVYGTDWRFGINHGLEDRINSFNRQTYGLVIPQMYVEIAYDDLSVKMGHFDDAMGYENVPAVLNPLYSHSYAMAFSEPLLVTGLLAQYKLNDRLSVLGGFHRGWMMFEDYNGCLDVLVGFRWTGPERRNSIDYTISSGPQDPDGRRERFVHSLVWKSQFTDRLQYILQHDYGNEQNTLFGRQRGDAQWYGINQYLLYELNPRLKLVGRFEWFRDDDGARVFGPPPAMGIRAWPGAPGFEGDFYELTLGLNWRPHANVLFRPEVRWDWYDGTRNIAGQLPFNDGQNSHQFLFGIDMIVTF